MTTRTTLPSGGWADLMDPADVTERFLRPMRHAGAALSAQLTPEARAAFESAAAADGTLDVSMAGAAATPELIAGLDGIFDIAICALVVAASFPCTGHGGHPAPDDLLDLSVRDRASLVAAVTPHLGAMNGIDFSPTPPGAETPTVPSSV